MISNKDDPFTTHGPPRRAVHAGSRMVSTESSYPGMERWRGKVALVTGASCGIGYDLSKRLCELGMNVVGCARSVEKIQVRLLNIFNRLSKCIQNIVNINWYSS